MMTNKGKLLLAQNVRLWKALLIVGTQPVAADTVAEVADLNTVNDLLVTAGATECSVGGYARQTVGTITTTEDDTNDRVNIDSADIAFGALAAGQTIIGIAFYDYTTDTTDSTRLLLGIDWFATGIPTNGSTFTYTVADQFRLT
jgi:hypothetical protein